MKVLSLQLHYLWDNRQGFICALLNQTSQEMCVCVCQNDGVVKGLHFQAAACPGRNEADRKGRRAQTAPSHTRTEPHTHTHTPLTSHSRRNLVTWGAEQFRCSVGGCSAAAATWQQNIWRMCHRKTMSHHWDSVSFSNNTLHHWGMSCKGKENAQYGWL